MYSYNCMNCAHPACQFRGKSNNYCGNYMMSKPYTLKLKLVLGGAKGEQSIKDRVCACNDNSVPDNHSTGINDLTANH